MTVTLLEGLDSPPLLEARLLRREAPVEDWTVEAVVDGDTLLIRYNDAADDLVRLGIEPRTFATSLARKMRVHRWMFETPREDLILPIGAGYLGRFTWQNAHDVIRCTAAYLTRPDKRAVPFPDLIRRDFTASEPNTRWVGDMERHEAPTDRAVVKGHRLRPVAAGRLKLRAA